MRALFIGGTGVISSACVARALEKGWEVALLNRGNHPVPAGVESIVCDINDEAAAQKVLADETFDVVAQFVGYNGADVARDIRLFSGRAKQYIYISSASAYQKPPVNAHITESAPLANPFWAYSRGKIEAEETLMRAYREERFPFTTVRPSHTYCDAKVPVAVHGTKGSWQVLQRILDEKPVVIHGDGTSLWTLTHASDFAKGFVSLMGDSRAIGNAFHITSDECMSWNGIYSVLADALERPLHAAHIATDFLAACDDGYDLTGNLLGDKAESVLFDNSKIKRIAPEFICTVSMAQGLRRCVEYVLAHPELQTPDPAFDAWCDRVVAAQGKARACFAGTGTI